jgi:hypothetical protein
LRADTITDVAGKYVFYTQYEPLSSIDSVFVDGSILENDEFCYDLVSGWVSVATPPTSSIIIHYQYSFVCDLAVSNWDTYNMVFGNTSPVPVTFIADQTLGFAPLDVQFTDNGNIISDWLWKFGDGETAGADDPLHTYSSGGVFDVYLEGILSDGWHNHIERDMIIVLADTLRLPEITADNEDSLIIPIALTTAHPLDNFVIPLSFAGPIELAYTGYDTDGCRTDGIADITVIPQSAPLQLGILFDMISSPLSPDTGAIINIHLDIVSGIGSAVIDTTTVEANSLNLDAEYVQYQPHVIAGSITFGYVCGDANGDGTVNVGDAVHLINYVFKGGPAPIPLEAGDANCDFEVNVGDAVYLINYVFKGGPAPCCP